MTFLLNFYQKLPAFKGKFRLGKILFSSCLGKMESVWSKGSNGLEYWLPNTVENIGAEILINGAYEPTTIKFIFDKLNETSVFFDVGANIGAISLPISRSKKGIEVYAFEPSEYTFQFLEKNKEHNQCKNIKTFQVAVNDTHNGQQFFYTSETLHGKSSFAPVFEKEAKLVNTISLDEFCNEKQIGIIDFMKVDVEGFEVLVFEGAKKMLENKRIKYIYFEFVDWAEKNAGYEIGAAQKKILEAGYKLFLENGEELVTPIIKGSVMLLAKC